MARSARSVSRTSGLAALTPPSIGRPYPQGNQSARDISPALRHSPRTPMRDLMDPSASPAPAASRAPLVLAFACLPFVAAGAGALAALGHVAPSWPGALGL